MNWVLLRIATVLAVSAAVTRAEDFNAALTREAAAFRERQASAADTLLQVRMRVANERAPLQQKLRAAEDRLIQAQTDLRRIELEQEQAAEMRRKVIKEIDDLGKTASYASTLAHDALRAAADAPAPGEAQVVSTAMESMLTELDRAAPAHRGQSAMDGVDTLLAYVEGAVGGRAAKGRSVVENDNQLIDGTFLFLGPDAFFRSADGTRFGSVRLRDGGAFPVMHRISSWQAGDATALFTSGTGSAPLDASGGKALRLAETTGSVWAHVQKGGVVAFVILAAGLLALMMIIQKTVELSRMHMAPPERVTAFLVAVGAREYVAAEELLRTFRGCTAQLFAAALQHRQDAKNLLEEILESVLLEQRLRFERRLPLLAVIATAAPLMGLLGTVIGMVRTFALITVFGTGNAGKLSSGISEVLVATELGLLVAIPTLVAHGFLAHRIQKNLSTLERQALQLVTALQRAKGQSESQEQAKALIP